jgi:hypothetical protein
MTAPLSADSKIARTPEGKFMPGAAPGPGRPAGSQSGRAAALAVLDRMMGTEANKAKLAAALEEHFDADPIRFFKTIIMPLLPQESKAEIKSEGGVIQWRSLAEMFPTKAKTADAAPGD